MDDNYSFSWQSVDALPLFSATIEVMLEETEKQHHYILYLKNGTYQIEKELINRIINFYKKQLDKVMYYEEQLRRWLINITSSSNLNEKTLSNISELARKTETIKKISHSIIEISKESHGIDECNNDALTVNKKMFLDFIDGKFEEKK
jgi:hypothetical protein